LIPHPKLLDQAIVFSMKFFLPFVGWRVPSPPRAFPPFFRAPWFFMDPFPQDHPPRSSPIIVKFFFQDPRFPSPLVAFGNSPGRPTWSFQISRGDSWFFSLSFFPLEAPSISPVLLPCGKATREGSRYWTLAVFCSELVPFFFFYPYASGTRWAIVFRPSPPAIRATPFFFLVFFFVVIFTVMSWVVA